MAQKGDYVLVAGKGHEDYQIIGDKVIHFDDAEVIRGIIKSMEA
jgi:UDP-N-acetylmuramoyl-L-alanyl-D-glutamate--2,6-diaminopimelate ligase